MPNKYLAFPRRKLLEAFEKRLYTQSNIQKICDGDDMLIPVDKIAEWLHDMGLILGKAINDVCEEDEA